MNFNLLFFSIKNNNSVAVNLIICNAILFFLLEFCTTILHYYNINFNYLDFVSLSSNYNNLATKPWSIITYAFFHSSFIHLLMNGIMLYFSSVLFATFFSQKQFFWLYILGAFFSGFVFLLGYSIVPVLAKQTTSLVGSSGAIMAVFFAVASFKPFMKVRLLAFEVSLILIAIVFVLLDFFQLNQTNTGGHIAHISGALFGFIFAKLIIKGTDITLPFTTFITQLKAKKHKQNVFKKVYVNAPKNNIKSTIVIKDKIQQQIDEILDKISKSGYDSLTVEEKKFLFKAGKQE